MPMGSGNSGYKCWELSAIPQSSHSPNPHSPLPHPLRPIIINFIDAAHQIIQLRHLFLISAWSRSARPLLDILGVDELDLAVDGGQRGQTLFQLQCGLASCARPDR